MDDVDHYRIYDVVNNIKNGTLDRERFIEQGKMLVQHLGNIEKMVLESGS